MALTSTPNRHLTDTIGITLFAVGAVLMAMLTLYLVGFDQRAISRSGMFVHELMHDGRHLMGLPCH